MVGCATRAPPPPLPPARTSPNARPPHAPSAPLRPRTSTTHLDKLDAVAQRGAPPGPGSGPSSGTARTTSRKTAGRGCSAGRPGVGDGGGGGGGARWWGRRCARRGLTSTSTGCSDCCTMSEKEEKTLRAGGRAGDVSRAGRRARGASGKCGRRGCEPAMLCGAPPSHSRMPGSLLLRRGDGEVAACRRARLPPVARRQGHQQPSGGALPGHEGRRPAHAAAGCCLHRHHTAWVGWCRANRGHLSGCPKHTPTLLAGGAVCLRPPAHGCSRCRAGAKANAEEDTLAQQARRARRSPAAAAVSRPLAFAVYFWLASYSLVVPFWATTSPLCPSNRARPNQTWAPRPQAPCAPSF